MKRLLREPLLQFAVLGSAIFAAYSLLGSERTPSDDVIVVSTDRIEHLESMFARTWGRSPTADERNGLIMDFVREEVACRESLALGLDRDDQIIRRRLRQKLEFVATDLIERAQPSDDDLLAFLDEHKEDFRIPSRLTFRQIYLNPQERGARIDADARELLERLSSGSPPSPESLGDRTLLDREFAELTLDEIEARLGQEFRMALAELATGVWDGPVPSTFGVHLVRVEERREGRSPTLDEVRDLVVREWAEVQRQWALELFYEQLLVKYRMIIETHDALDAGPSP